MGIKTGKKLIAALALLFSSVSLAAVMTTDTVAVPTSVTGGAATAVGTLQRKTVSIEGTFTATYQVQISNDTASPPGASSWINEGAALTAAGALEITKPCVWVRVNCTAYTSGTPTGRVVGFK